MPSTAETLGTLENGVNRVGSSGGVDLTAQQSAAAQARFANGGLDPLAGAAPAAALGSGMPAVAVAGATPQLGADSDFIPQIATGVPAAIGATVAPSGHSFVPNPTPPGFMLIQNTHTGDGAGGNNGGNGTGGDSGGGDGGGD